MQTPCQNNRDNMKCSYPSWGFPSALGRFLTGRSGYFSDKIRLKIDQVNASFQLKNFDKLISLAEKIKVLHLRTTFPRDSLSVGLCGCSAAE